MSDAFVSAYYALEGRMKMVEVITNNLANAQTTGFKRDFGRVLESAEGGLDISTVLDLAPGDYIGTKNDLDAAIEGPGFFAIETPAGIRYTRAGSFELSADGDLVTKDGMTVLSSSGSSINAGDGVIAIRDGGSVTVDGNEIATLKIVTFKKPELLQKEGLNRLNWTGTPQDIEDAPDPRVKGGYLERSNVNTVEEMVNMMSAYREFEAAQRTLKTVGDMNSRLIQELGKLT